MHNKITFISFYTKNTIYEDIFYSYLKPGLDKWKLPCKIYPIESNGVWFKNAIQKPIIIQQALADCDTNLIWIDADATINEFPSLLFNIPEEFDIGLNWLDWHSHYGRPNDIGKQEMLDGTVYWKNSDKMKLFVEEWKQRSTNERKDHQRTLARMIEEKKDINVFKLPRTYSYIYCKPNGQSPLVPLLNPIITHWQKSREAKIKLKKEGK